MKTVWVYVNTRKKIGDVDYLKVFASARVADRWLKKNDRVGAAVRCEVLKASAERILKRGTPSGKKTIISNGALTEIFFRRMRAYSDCPYTGTPVAIIPAGNPSEWKALTAPYVVKRYPRCAKRVEEVEKELQKLYSLKKN